MKATLASYQPPEIDIKLDDSIVQTDMPQLEIDSQLMENYRMASLVKAGSHLCPVPQPDGATWIFSLTEDRQIAVSRPSEKATEPYKTTYLTPMDRGQYTFHADRFRDENFVAVCRQSVFDDRVDLYVYTYDDDLNPVANVFLGSYAHAITAVRIFGRKINGTYYLGLLRSVTSEPDDMEGPYHLDIYVMDQLDQLLKPLTFSKVVDSPAHDFGVTEDGKVGVFSMVTPGIFTRKAMTYTGVYRTDKNGAGKGDMSVFKATNVQGFKPLGDLAESGLKDDPDTDLQLVASVERFDGEDPVVSYPTDLELVYMDNGTGGHNEFAESGHDGQLFRPVHAQSKYKALGCVGSGQKNSKVKDGKDYPHQVDYLMVNEKYLKPGVSYRPSTESDCAKEAAKSDARHEDCNLNLIWRTGSSGDYERITAHSVTGERGELPLGSLFAVHNGKYETNTVNYLIDEEVKDSFVFFADLAGYDPTTINFEVNRFDLLEAGQDVAGRSFTVANLSGLPSRPFLLDEDGHIYDIQPRTGSGRRFQLISSGNAHLVSIKAAYMADGRVEMYALGEDDHLYHAVMKSNDADSWTEFEKVTIAEEIEILDYELSGTAANNVCYAYGVNNALFTISYDQHTEALRFIPVILADEGNMQTFTSFNMEIDLLTTFGMAMPGQAMEIWADSRFSAQANGQPFILGPRKRTLHTLANGRLTMTIEAFDITAPVVYLSLPEVMAPGEYVTVHPNAHIQQMLKGINAETLANAQKNDKSSTPTPLLEEGKYSHEDLTALSDGINAAFELMEEEPAANDQYLSKRVAGMGWARFHQNRPAVHHGHIRSKQLKAAHWMIDFTSGKPKYKKLTAKEALAEREAMAKQFREGKNKSSNHWWDVSWGSAVHSIKRGLKELGKFVVTTTAHGIEVTLHALKDAVNYVYEGTIHLIAQVFDAVQCFFTTVGAYFPDLVQWLGYLFNWQDILLTHQAIVYTVNEVLDFLPRQIGEVKKQIDQQFDGLANAVAAGASQIRSQLETASFGGEKQNAAMPADTNGTAKHNVALNGLQANGHKAQFEQRHDGGLDDLLGNLLTLLEDYGAIEAFERAGKHLAMAMKDREQAFKLILTALVDLLEGLAEATVAIARVMIDGFLDMMSELVRLFKELLNQPIQIPLVSNLYGMMTKGEDLTILNLVGLLLAIPVTPMAKALTGATPFADERELDGYKAQFDLKGLAKGKRARSIDFPEQPAWFHLVVASGNFLQIFVTGFLDVQPMVPMVTTGGAEPNEGTGLLTGRDNFLDMKAILNEIFSTVSICLDVAMQAFMTPLNSLTQFFLGNDDSKYVKAIMGWVVGWIPIAMDVKSVWQSGTIAGLADHNKTLIKCVAHFAIIIIRIVQWCKGNISWEDALKSILWRIGKFSVLLKLPVVATPNTILAYAGIHAVGNAIHSVGEVVDFVEES